MAQYTYSRSVFGRILSVYRGIADFAGGLNDILSVVGTVAGVFGLTAAKMDLAGPQIPLDRAPFAVRFVFLILFAAGLGWGLGLAVRQARWLARDTRVMASALAAVLFAGLLGGLADWLVPPRQYSELPQQMMLTLLATMVAMRCCIQNLSASRGLSARSEPAERALVPLVFVVAAAVIMGLAQMGAG